MNTPRSSRSRLLAVVTAIGLGLSVMVGASPAAADSAPPDPTSPSSPPTVSADALPTAQINGVAWSQVVVGNTVYVAGNFSTARPAGAAPGVNTVPRNNLLAYDIRTGVLNPTFDPNLNGQALALAASPDGSRIYVVGDFTSIDGVGYYRIAAFSTATGQVIPSFKPILGSQGRSLAVTNTTVYVGGTFRSVNGEPRDYLAAVNASNGAVQSWTANTDAVVDALTLTKDGSKLVVGGRFTDLAGAAFRGLGAVNAATGSPVPWAANSIIRNAGTQASITSLLATEDRVYGSGYVFGSGGNLEGIFSADPDTGEIIWIEDCHGDTYSVFTQGDAVYGAGHPHYCGNIGGFPQTDPWTMYYGFAFSKAATGTITPDPHGYYNFAGWPSPTLLNWFPKFIQGSFTGQGQAGWSVTGNDDYVVYAGEFPYVNGVPQYGLVRFAVPEIAPNKVAPIVNTELVPTIVSFKSGEVRVSWTATYDYDNANLTYKLVRDGAVNTPVYETTQLSNFYTRPQMGFIDTGLTPGSSHSYRLYVSDPFGNTISRLGPTVTVSSDTSGGEYPASVANDDPNYYWPLDESSGAIGYDHAGFSDLRLGAGVTRGTPGIVGTSTGSTFSGTSNGFGVTPSSETGPDVFSAEAWVKTTTTRGGKIIGFGNASTGESGSYDRHVYMDNSGRIWFGVHPGGVRTVNSSATFNDGQWHHIVATLGSGGMVLYVDGKVVGARTDVTSGQAYSGYWRVGGDNLNGWTSRPSNNYLSGSIAQVAVYPTALSRPDVVSHYVASGRVSPIPAPPADDYGSAVYDSDPTLYWRLDDSSGTKAADSSAMENAGTYNGSVTKGEPGAIAGVSNDSVAFAPPSGVSSDAQFTNPSVYSLELWFSTESVFGGKLIGFGSERTGVSSNYDRHLYMQDDGRLVFGTWTGFMNTITTTDPYNDGEWHHAVAMQSNVGMALYIDGELIGTNGQTSAQDYSGYWRIGGDNTWGSTSPYFSGHLDEVAVYPRALSASTVSEHFALGSTGEPANQAPTAEFSSSVDTLAASFNAGASDDPDGTISTYAWDFGDSTNGTGETTSHNYAEAGTYTVTLTVTDNDGATDTITHPVTVTAAPVNQAPTAEFSSSVDNLAASFNAGASDDSDGTISTYAWNFGDSTSGTGETTSHSYAEAGTYTVTLTVTDNDGATDTATHPVTVTAPPDPGTGLASDDFSRTVSSGWGTAPVGGPWTISGNAANLQVADGTGQVSLPPGSTRTATLGDVSSTTADTRVTFSLNQVPTGGGSYNTIIGRQVGASSYAANAWVRSNGSVFVVLRQGSSVLTSAPISGLTYTAGAQLNLRLEVVGTSPTTVRAKIWAVGQPEPASWHASVTDSTAALQSAGSVALQSYLAGSATASIITRFDNFSVGGDEAPPTNQAPTAEFSSSVNNLAASFNAGASDDSDGTISSYAWNFGDSTSGTGETTSHDYAEAGTYTVTLTVTDNDGATDTITHPVTVTTPPEPGSELASDDFGRTVATGWGTAPVGGPWTISGNAANLQVADGTGQVDLPPGSTRTATLGGVSSTSTDATVTFSLNQVPTGGGSYNTIIGRQVGASSYAANAWVRSNGSVFVVLKQGSTALSAVAIPGLTYTAGAELKMRLEVTGTSPTTVRAKIWLASQPEPASWHASVTDSTAALQSAGSIGLQSYLSGSATAAIITRFDNFVVRPPQ